MNWRDVTLWIAIHCSDTPPSMDIGEAEISRWHKQKGWEDGGYNVVIRRNGMVEVDRPLDAQGAHVRGYNDVSVGVCLIGGRGRDNEPEANFTPQQYESLRATVDWLLRVYPLAAVKGHRDFDGVSKKCPCFDAGAWYYGKEAA